MEQDIYDTDFLNGLRKILNGENHIFVDTFDNTYYTVSPLVDKVILSVTPRFKLGYREEFETLEECLYVLMAKCRFET